MGEVRDKSLYAVPAFGEVFSGYERQADISIPERGEMRFTYFLKSPSKVIARIRVNRDGATMPMDVQVPNPVVGAPTEIRIPFADFKPAYAQAPALAAGETARMFYIFGSPGCGLRLDSFSLVELRK
jgi:hypothetical protein